MLLTPEGFPIDSTHRILPRLIPEGSPVDSTHRIPPRLTPEGFPVDSTHPNPLAGTRRGLLPIARTQTLHRTPEGSPIDSTHPNPLRRTPEGSLSVSAETYAFSRAKTPKIPTSTITSGNAWHRKLSAKRTSLSGSQMAQSLRCSDVRRKIKTATDIRRPYVISF